MTEREARQNRLFAVVPAAGHSRRMGQPKLLLPLGSKSVIAHLLYALAVPEIKQTIVVVRSDDATLANQVYSAGAIVVQPEVPPEDMRDSVQYALGEIRNRFQPNAADGWILVPADHPVLDQKIIAALIETWNASDAEILVPTFENRRGHPTIFRWTVAEQIRSIPSDAGLNWLLRQGNLNIQQVSLDHREVLFDLDTPSDYAELVQRYGKLSGQ